MITLRRATADDLVFLEVLDREITAPKFIAAGLPDDTLDVLCRQQFQARRTGYRATYPHHEQSIIELDGESVGQISIDWSTDRIVIVDISVAEAHRGRGIGSDVLTTVISGPDRRERSIELTVDSASPAQDLYRLLGFVPWVVHDERIGMRHIGGGAGQDG